MKNWFLFMENDGKKIQALGVPIATVALLLPSPLHGMHVYTYTYIFTYTQHELIPVLPVPTFFQFSPFPYLQFLSDRNLAPISLNILLNRSFPLINNQSSIATSLFKITEIPLPPTLKCSQAPHCNPTLGQHLFSLWQM